MRITYEHEKKHVENGRQAASYYADKTFAPLEKKNDFPTLGECENEEEALLSTYKKEIYDWNELEMAHDSKKIKVNGVTMVDASPNPSNQEKRKPIPCE